MVGARYIGRAWKNRVSLSVVFASVLYMDFMIKGRQRTEFVLDDFIYLSV